jgi:hypothetical protein
MIGNASFNPTQSINSFLKPMGLSLSSRDQMAAKVKALALTAIPLGIILISGLTLASAVECQCSCLDECGNNASRCFKKCMENCR